MQTSDLFDRASGVGQKASMLPRPLSAIIFDKDGLLFDVEPIEQSAAIAACRAVGYAMPSRWYRSLIGNPRDTNDDRIRSRFGSAFPLEEYHRVRQSVFAERSRCGIPLKEGAKEIIKMLHELGIRAAVATSSSAERTERELNEAGLSRYIDVIVTRDDVKRGKPDPESYTKARTLLGVPISACLALEDSPSGALAAIRAGISTVLIPDIVLPPPSIAQKCIAVVNSLRDVSDMILS